MVSYQLPGRTVIIQSNSYLYFSGTSYLGLIQCTKFKSLVKEGLDKIGVHYGASRRNNVQIGIYDEAERVLCERTGAESSLIVSSGSFAGFLASQLKPEHTTVMVAPGTHPALWKHFQPPEDISRSDWELKTLKTLSRLPASAVALTNTIDPLSCSPIDADWMRGLPKNKGSIIMIDDSHSIGISGSKGWGKYAEWAKESPLELVGIASMGKALGIPAGCILGTENQIRKLKQSAVFGGSSPANAAFLYAFIKGGEVYKNQLDTLKSNIAYFLSNLTVTEKFKFLPDYPVFLVPEIGLKDYLLERGIIISSFSYPGENDPPLSRIIISALHEKKDIDILCTHINKYYENKFHK